MTFLRGGVGEILGEKKDLGSHSLNWQDFQTVALSSTAFLANECD